MNKNFKLSERAKKIPVSPIRKLLPYADEAKKRGIKVYHLNIGQPDIPTPDVFFKAIKETKEKVIAYGPSQGLPILREAIAEYLRKNSINAEPDDVFITIGGSEAILFSYLLTCDKDDEVLIPEPCYANYISIGAMCEIKLIPIRTTVETGFHLPPAEEIKKLVTKKTKAIVLISPNNPTGTVYSENELREIVKVAREFNLCIISDEVYREFTFDNIHHTSIFHIKEAEDISIMIDSISKRFSACGARIGFIFTKNEKFKEALWRIPQARLCPPTLEQYGATACFKEFQKIVPRIKEEFERRRNVVYEEILKTDGLFTQKPEGAFYTVVRLPVDDAEDFVKFMLTDFNVNGKTVMLAPANGFYVSNRGKNEARIAYVLEEEKLREAMQILREGLKEYAKRKSN